VRSTARHGWLLAASAIVVSGCSAYDASLLRGRSGDSIAVDGGKKSIAGERAASNPDVTAGRAGQASGIAGRGGGSAGERAAQAPEGDGRPAAPGGTTTDAGSSDPAPAADGGGPSCVADPGADYCGSLPALPGVPVMDGQLECGLRLLAVAPQGWHGAAPPDKRASYAAAWRNDGLYLYVEVHGDPIQPHLADQAIFCGDAVELFVDADADVDDGGAYGATGTMQFLIAAPAVEGAAIEATRFIEGVSQGPWISKALRTTRLPDGYSVEAFIGAADIGLWEWVPNMRVGFSVGVDVSAPQGAAAGGCGRAGVYFLRVVDPLGDCPGEPWCDAGAFCRSMLMGR
jgi:hypothetical protein